MVATALGAGPLAAPLAAQQRGRGLELGLQATGTASDPAVGVAGLYAGLRGSSRVRVVTQLGAGVTEHGAAAWRGELAAHFLLNPFARRGVGFYGGGGVAAAGAHGLDTQGYALLTLGVESRPGASSGWALEVGLGGGVRVSAGWRWRR
ncbi:MAG TPA: hypothetical protein VFS40_04140 [Gemmatimonadales bacterium]|nr:hypothetical protein [Gemmatimonadales bacterium]